MFFLAMFGWIVVGLVVGFVASKAVNLRGDDPRMGVGIAAAAAFVAGLLQALIGSTGTAGWSPWGLAFAAAGALVAVAIWHAVRSRFISRGHQTTRSSY